MKPRLRELAGELGPSMAEQFRDVLEELEALVQEGDYGIRFQELKAKREALKKDALQMIPCVLIGSYKYVSFKDGSEYGSDGHIL